MAKCELIRYSTGFYGSESISSKAVVSPFDEARTARLQYDPTIFNRNPKTEIILNRDITELHTAYMVNAGLFLRNFNNREQVILQALRTIGKDFSVWFSMHAKDEKIDRNLIDFIEDTCLFIQTGQRRYPIESWSRMVETKLGTNNYRDVPKNISDLTYISSHHTTGARRRSTCEVIQKWLSQEAGITDMLLSLYIMFGPIEAPR